jgi:hypothetical protein
MKQSRLMSLIESVANVIVGYGVAVVTPILIFPLCGLHTTLAQNLKMGAVFTVLCRARHNTDYADPCRPENKCQSDTCDTNARTTPHNHPLSINGIEHRALLSPAPAVRGDPHP